MSANNDAGEKIEDIIKSVRNIIDSHNNNAKSTFEKPQEFLTKEQESIHNVDNILELTSIIEEKDLNECLISDQVKIHAKEAINKFINVFKQEYDGKIKSMDAVVNDLMRPLIKDWLNNNLPQMVEKIVSEEIKKIIPK